MGLGRKTTALLLALGLLGVPALVLRTLCVGRSCDQEASASAEVPFCSLDAGLRSRISAGFYEGRSPEVVAVARAGGARSSPPAAPWPSRATIDAARIPIAFAGAGIEPGDIPGGTTLDAIAPTLAEIASFERPFPEVRSGEPVPAVGATRPPRLLLQVVLKGIGSDDLETADGSWPYLNSLMDSGAATLDGDAGSLPLDSAAILATIGAGGLPRQHGVTGSLVRNEEGELVRPFSRRADPPVIAALGDDLDEALDGEPLIGIVGTDTADRGAIGGRWYIGDDDDEVVIDRRDQIEPALEMLARGFGRDEVVDLMGVVMEGTVSEMDEGLRRIVERAEVASGDSVAVVVTATGSRGGGRAQPPPRRIARAVHAEVGAKVVEAVTPGGVFTDQRVLARSEIPEDAVVDALRGLGRIVDDAFPAIAVSFARYC